MSAAYALKVARDAGVRVGIDGDTLTLDAEAAPPSALLDLLVHHKAQVVALLRHCNSGWSGDDWRALYDEWAGTAEFNDGSPRPEAEARAFKRCIDEWLNQNPVFSPPGRCLACGGVENTDDVLLPFGSEPTGHVWLHSRCWPAWYAGRKAEAGEALKVMGIEEPLEFPDDFGKNRGA